MSNIDKQVVDEVTDGVLAGGAAGIEAVVGMFKGPGEGGDYKAHYALHCAVIAVGTGREEERRMVASTLAKCVGRDLPKGVKAYLLQELQAVGTAAEAEAIGAFLCDDELCEPAAAALMAIRRGARRQFEKTRFLMRRASARPRSSRIWRFCSGGADGEARVDEGGREGRPCDALCAGEGVSARRSSVGRR